MTPVFVGMLSLFVMYIGVVVTLTTHKMWLGILGLVLMLAGVVAFFSAAYYDLSRFQ